MARSALPRQTCVPVTLDHSLTQTLAATKSRSLLHVFNGKLAHGFCLVISVIQHYGLLTRLCQVHLVPGRNSAIGLQTAIVGMNSLLHTVLYPPLRTMFLAVGHHAHRQLDDMRNQFGHFGLRCEAYARRHFRRCSQAPEILLDRHVLTEMQVVLQHIAVQIPRAMEIAGGKPVAIENLRGVWTTDNFHQQTLKLIVADSVLFARTDIVVAFPELFRHIGTTHPFQQTSGVLYRSPFQHTAYRHVEHNWVVVLQNSRIQNTRLSQTHPFLDARIGDKPLCGHFGDAVMVVSAHTNRITCTTPM